jgi:hypothetical protein
MLNDGLLVDEVRAIQSLLLESGRSQLSEEELDHLRGVIRLTVEFSHHLEEDSVRPLEKDELRYLGDTIFSGVDSFLVVSNALRVMTGGTKSTLPWDRVCMGSLKQEFDTRYRNFFVEASFEERCRLLLDLFRLQIIFAGLSYD